MAFKPMEPTGNMEYELKDDGGELNALFRAYHDACPTPDASVNFMPALWAKIEARQSSTHLFSRMARALVGAALAATVILGMLSSTGGPGPSAIDGTYMEALTADHVSTLDAMNLDRISELE